MGKYRNKKVLSDGELFDSRKEAKRYHELLLLERAGEITELKRQQKFVLLQSQYHGGKCVERPLSYYADFTYRDKGGELVVEDVKSKATKTPQYIIKRKLMLYFFGIRVQEV